MSSDTTARQLQLAVPQREPSDAAARELHPDALSAWLSVLPLANAPESAHQILDRLRRGNRAIIEPALRHQAVESLRGPVDALVETINTRYLGAALPLAARARAHAATVHDLLEEMAYACKIVIADLLASAARTEQDLQVLFAALHCAVVYLGRMALENYLLHAPESAGTWGELQRLYRYAEQTPGPEQHAAEGRRENAQTLITHAYLRIALLALANPYHLMPGEAQSVYADLEHWSRSCRLLRPQPGAVLAGKFIADLARDAPPRYVSAAAPGNFEDPCIIDLHELLTAIDRQISDITLHDMNRAPGAHLSIAQRMRRDMLARLKHAWGGRMERKLPRADRQSRVYICLGLGASHHFIAGEVPFTPERDEIRQHRGEHMQRGSMLSLVPKEHEHWKAGEQSERLARSISQSRASQFDLESPELDIWRKIHSTSSQARESFEPMHITKVLRQKNQGAGGLCLNCPAESQIQARVGELLAYKSDADPEHEWRIGMIRWLRCLPGDALDLGVMRLADEALAVAVRCVDGIGKGGEYCRALLASRGTPALESLIVPAAIYDIDSVLATNTGDELRYLRLTQMITTTNSFSQFTFEPADPPESELAKIESIKTIRT